MDEDDLLPADEHADVIGRLRRFGAAPMPPGLAARSLDRIHGNARPRGRALPVKVLVAATAGALVFGGVGLAAADVLPAPVQDAAHTTLDRVGVHVPPGHDRYTDPAICPGGPYRNHGAYVRAHKNDPAAGKSPCGKPVQSVNPSSGKKNDDTKGTEDHGVHGPPPWAHNKNKNKKPHGSDDKNGAEAPDHAKPPSVAAKPLSTATTNASPTTSTTTVSTSTAASPSTTSTSSP